MEVLFHLSGLSFVESTLIYDIWNGLVYDALTSAPNMWLDWLPIDLELYDEMLCV